MEATMNLLQDLPGAIPADAGCGVCHMVYFRDLGASGERLVRDVRDQLMENQGALKIRDIWIGKHKDEKKASDSLFKARLRISQEFDYLLCVRFDNSDDLVEYYCHPVHCDIRRTVYKGLSQGLALLYDLIEQTALSPRDRSLLFEEVIEPVVSRYMVRQDYSGMPDKGGNSY